MMGGLSVEFKILPKLNGFISTLWHKTFLYAQYQTKEWSLCLLGFGGHDLNFNV